MLSRSLMPGRQSRSFPSSCRRTRAGSSARNRIRPSSRTWSGSFSTRRDWSAASMLERSPPPYGPSKRISRDRPLPPTAMRFQLEDRCTGFAALQTARGTTMGIRRYSVATAAVCAACGAAPRAGRAPAPPIPAVSTKALDAHLKYLADDLLEGRAPGTRGGMLAAKYIAAQFEAFGLEPAGPDGSYFQPVALVGIMPPPSHRWGKAGA